MARPTKIGLDYFPLDVQFSDEVEAVESVHGNDGFAVIIKAWQALYQTEDGRLDCSGVLRRKTLAKRANISEELWIEIIETCIDAGLFDRGEWVQGKILTSNGVKKRIAQVMHEREEGRKRVEKRWKKGSSPKNDTEPESSSPNNPTEKDTSESESEKESEKESEREEDPYGSFPENFRKSVFRDEAFRFSDWFSKNLKPGSVKVTKTVRNQWALVWFHLRQTDKRSDVKEMTEAIEWARGDPFWTTNFNTPLKLRKKNGEGIMYIDVFIEQYRKQKQQKNGKRGITPVQFGSLLQWIDDNPALSA